MPRLRDDYVVRPHPRRLAAADPQFGEMLARHEAAVSAGEPVYEDPATGLSVFTASFLADRGWCCESGCRHCPFLID